MGLPARFDKAGGGVLRYRTQVGLIDRRERADAVEDVPGGGRGVEGELFQQSGRVPPDLPVAIGDQRQVVERGGLCQLVRFRDAPGERLPWDDRLDGGKRIGAALPRVDQRVADACVEPHLLVDRLALVVEGCGVSAFRIAEELADHPVVQLEDLVDDAGALGSMGVEQHRHQRRVSPPLLEVAQVLRAHLCPLARQLGQTALMHRTRKVVRQVNRADRREAIEVRQEIARGRLTGRLTQPRQPESSGDRRAV